MRVLGQSSRPAARAAAPARGHTPKLRTGVTRPARAGGLVRPIPARAASDEHDVSHASVSLAQASDDGPSDACAIKTKTPPSVSSASASETRARASDVARRVSSLRVAERSLARASSLAKLVDERRAPNSFGARSRGASEQVPSAVASTRGEENARRSVPEKTAGKKKAPRDDDASHGANKKISAWSSAKRAVVTHAMFLEPPDLVRDRTWDALVLSGIDAARLAARARARGDAEATLRRSRTSPFAASARRENARRHDRGRVVFCSGERKKRLLVRAQRSSPYWRACRTEFEFARFAEAFEFVRYAPGEHIVRAGDVADFALLLVEGGARLETNNAFQQWNNRRTT